MPDLLRSQPASRLSATTVFIGQEDFRVRSGDLWQLGPHRLLCGDCTDAAQVALLMQPDTVGQTGNVEADMVFLDPPYGVEYGVSRGCRQPGRAMTGDNLGEYGTYDLLRRALHIAFLKPGGAFYLCSPAGSNETIFRLALRDAGLPLKQSLVWAKHRFVLSRQDYQWQHEMLLYGWKPGAPHYFVPDRTQSTVWQIARPQSSPYHPTTKPLVLVERAICNSSRDGEIVYDGFGGSGTTLLACEVTGRRCRMMEIEPRYCDTILRRWEAATGKQALLISRDKAGKR